MKTHILLAAALLLSLQLLAQKDYRIAKSGGKLVLNNLSNLVVEGYDGKEIILSVSGNNSKSEPFTQKTAPSGDPRAKGLSELNNSGFDNTGLGLSVSEKGNTTIVSNTHENSSRKTRIQVPHSVALSINNSLWPFQIQNAEEDSGAILVRKFKGEIDVSVHSEDCRFEEITGPLSMKSFFGDVEVSLKENFQGPITIQTVRGLVDLTVDKGTRADVVMSTVAGGTIYASKDLKLAARTGGGSTIGSGWETDTVRGNRERRVIVVPGRPRVHGDPNVEAPPAIAYAQPRLNMSIPGASNFNGTLNGGGAKIVIQSTGGNIYLRH